VTNYSDLLASVAMWIHRTDLTSQMPDFIALAEAEFNRRLRVRDMETAIPRTALVSGEYTLPADFEAMKYLKADTSPPQTLLLTTQEYLADKPDQAGTPLYFAISGIKAICWPTSGNIKGVYYAKIPALTSLNTTNWLMTKHPDLYLFAVLEQAAIYTRDTMLEGVMSQRTERLIASINSDSKSAEISGGPLTVRVR
jgi:hypothetical protein